MMPAASRVPISVIIPVHRAGDVVRECLHRVTRAEPPPDDVIVVLDGDDPDARELAEGFDVSVLGDSRRRGPAAARNLGARHARHELLFFIDSDVWVPGDLFPRALAVAERFPGTVAFIGSYDDRPSAPGVVSQYKNLAHHFVHQTSHEDGFTFWGACGVIRTDEFHALGGYDESYTRPCVEDIELGYRLRAAGHGIRLCRDLQVTHAKEWRFLPLVRTEIFDRAVPWTRLILRSRRLDNDLNLGWRNRVAVALVMVLAATLLAATVWPWALLAALVAVFVLVGIDLPLLGFFRSRRGSVFAAKALVLHWGHYLCSGVGLLLGVAGSLFARGRAPGRAKEARATA